MEKRKYPIKFLNKEIRGGKKIIIFICIAVFIGMVILAFNKFYVREAECEKHPYLFIESNQTDTSRVNLTEFYSEISIPKDQIFCIGKIEHRNVTDKTYNVTYLDPFCNGTVLNNNANYSVFCSNRENRSLFVCSVLLNCKEVRKWKIR